MAYKLGQAEIEYRVSREEIIDTLEAAGLGLENHNPNANLTPEQEKAIRDYYGNANHENDDRKPKARTVIKQTEKAEFPILVRISDRNAAQEFDHSKNNYQFDEIIEYLSNNVCQTYSYRVSDTTYCIVVPIEQFDGQVEIFCDYRHYTFDMRLKKRGFTRFVKVIDLPDTEFCKVHFCTFKFLKRNEDAELSDMQVMDNFKKQLDALEVMPRNAIKEQCKIWSYYIKAQQHLYNKLAEPYTCVGKPVLTEKPASNGSGIISYNLEFEINAEKSEEFRQFEDKLLDNYNILADVSADGSAFMTREDIFKWIDRIIAKDFHDSIVREPKIGCILQIRPYNNSEKLQKAIGSELKMIVRRSSVDVYDYDKPENVETKLKPFGYKWTGYDVKFKLINDVDAENEKLINDYSVTLNNDTVNKKYQKDNSERELLIPNLAIEEYTKFLSNEVDPEEGTELLYQSLCMVYGTQNVSREVFLHFHKEDSDFDFDNFDTGSWKEIDREIALLQFVQPRAEGENGGNNIYFEFETLSELKDKIEQIEQLDSFVIVKSPRDDDFKFKVKFDIVSDKSYRQLFHEKLEQLSGVEFCTEVPTENGRNNLIYLGKLNSRESSMSKLVLYLPNIRKEDKIKNEKFLRFWNEDPVINHIHANLRGDIVKISWLKQTMDKLTVNDGWEPDSRPVNERIKEFIFDSTKAKPIEKFENVEIESTEEYDALERNAILNLNDSQKIAVLKGLSAEDLCLLQGPPGTGKTTVIAELIWQHIRQNQKSKLLLTSETNLAVDNALERLMNGKTANESLGQYLTIIKPIRFGKSIKFEEEGKRYSLERIEKWIDNDVVYEDEYEFEEETLEKDADVEDFDTEVSQDNYEDNVVQHWMSKIANRAKHKDPKYAEVLKDWSWGLERPDIETKEMFKDAYMRNVNVIGSTCSSTGSPGFKTEYLKTFRQMDKDDQKAVHNLIRRINNPSSKLETIKDLAEQLGLSLNPKDPTDFTAIKKEIYKRYSIAFDIVIMDEASKALPPELLLPLCFGKKSIVIGDHRQLPPMLNEKDFREALSDLNDDEASRISDDLDKNFVDTSQFKRLILGLPSKSSIKSTFDTQYRMHPSINDVIKQFYIHDESKGLWCGLNKDLVDSPDLSLPDSRYHGLSHVDFISPDTHTIWVNVEAPERTEGTSKVNEMEVEAVKTVLTYLKKSESFDRYMDFWRTNSNILPHKRHEEQEIGIISFYGKQVKRLNDCVRPFARTLDIPIRLNTVDKFQGMERNIVIVSTVRSDKRIKLNNDIENNDDIGFARSPERLNVALSRARRLLIVVGNKNFFANFKDKEGNYLYRNAIKEIERTGKVIEYKNLTAYRNNE